MCKYLCIECVYNPHVCPPTNSTHPTRRLPPASHLPPAPGVSVPDVADAPGRRQPTRSCNNV